MAFKSIVFPKKSLQGRNRRFVFSGLGGGGGDFLPRFETTLTTGKDQSSSFYGERVQTTVNYLTTQHLMEIVSMTSGKMDYSA